MCWKKINCRNKIYENKLLKHKIKEEACKHIKNKFERNDFNENEDFQATYQTNQKLLMLMQKRITDFTQGYYKFSELEFHQNQTSKKNENAEIDNCMQTVINYYKEDIKTQKEKTPNDEKTYIQASVTDEDLIIEYEPAFENWFTDNAFNIDNLNLSNNSIKASHLKIHYSSRTKTCN